MIDGPGNVTTTSGEVFTHTDHCLLAAMVLRRFGGNAEAATAAWKRMLANNTEISEFMELASPGNNLLHHYRKKWNSAVS